MKPKHFKQKKSITAYLKNVLMLLVFLVAGIAAVSAQAPQVNCVCAICGVPCSSPASAHTNPSCPVYKSYHSANNGNASGNKTSFEQQIMLDIFSNALTSLLSSNKPNEQDKEKIRLEEERKQKALAVLLAKQKRYSDSIAQAKHDIMMKAYKQLDGSGDLKLKTLDDEWKSSTHYTCNITAFKGDVSVYKTNGKRISLSADQTVELAPGDWIKTGTDSRLKLHYAFEKGGEDIILGSNTTINIVSNEDGTQVPKLMQGDMYVVNNMVTEKIANTVLDAKDELKKDVNGLLGGRFKARFKIYTPTAVCAVRGTEFTLHVDEFDNTEVNVKNGLVDLTGNLINGTIILTAGTKGIVKATGEILGPLKMDEKQFDGWNDNWQ